MRKPQLRDHDSLAAHVHRLTEYAASLTTPAPAPGFHEYLHARRPGDWRRRRTALLRRIGRTA